VGAAFIGSMSVQPARAVAPIPSGAAKCRCQPTNRDPPFVTIAEHRQRSAECFSVRLRSRCNRTASQAPSSIGVCSIQASAASPRPTPRCEAHRPQCRDTAFAGPSCGARAQRGSQRRGTRPRPADTVTHLRRGQSPAHPYPSCMMRAQTVTALSSCQLASRVARKPPTLANRPFARYLGSSITFSAA
jgi:hypothetical protein